MRRSLVALFLCLVCTSAFAQNNRSAVSISGNDAAACTVPDPCRTFGVALSKTNSGGEVVALTSGGYGPFTIDRSATIIAAPGIYAALVATSGDAIVVNSGASGRVVIRGLYVYGMSSGGSGIAVTGSGAETHVENCVIEGFAGFGIIAFFNVRVSNTTVRNSGTGIEVDNVGAALKATINRVEVRDIHGGNPFGIVAGRNSRVSVRDSVIANVGFDGLRADGGIMTAENNLVSECAVGILSANGGAALISNNVVTGNGVGMRAFSTIYSWGNNKVGGNITADIDVGALSPLSTM